MIVRLIAGLVVLAVGAAVLFVFPQWQRERASLLQPDDANVVARGEAVYARECASCHGADRKGQPGWETRREGEVPPAPPHDGSGHTWQHPDSALIELTKFGSSDIACRTLEEGAMPEFQEALSDDEVIAVLSYVKAQWPAEIRRRHDDVNALYSRAE